MKTYAYTLLELMIALAILALLVGIAVPIYIDQMNKAQVAAALNTLSSLEHTAKVAYEENPSNTTITYAGVNLVNNTVTAMTEGPVVNVLYIHPGGNANVSASQFLVCVYVGNLNFTNYVAPTAGNSGSYARICKEVTANDPIYSSRCGALQGNSIDLPTRFLPTACNCPDIWGGSC